MTDYPDISTYSRSTPPPEDHPDLGKWVWKIFELGYSDKERLGLLQRWPDSYKLFRGNHWGDQARTGQSKVTVNLFFANVNRTVANVTNRNPTVEVVDLDGHQDHADQVLTTKLRKWWSESEQQNALTKSCLNNEIYGITVEKACWDAENKEPAFPILDPYAFFPESGLTDDLQTAGAIVHAYAMDVGRVEAQYGVKGVTGEDVRTILGRDDRENVRPNATMLNVTTGIVQDQVKTGVTTISGAVEEALVVECWTRDFSTVTEETITETGEVTRQTRLKYPDGIRMITVANRGELVLADMPNPNINFELPLEVVSTTYAWGRYPFYHTNSYEDPMCIWGFSAAEQVNGLNKEIDQLLTRLTAWANRALFPPLRVDKGCGITKKMINNKPNLVLMPNRPNARIEFIPVPNLPASFFRVLDLLTSFHDRVYQIEDADRGVQPTGVVAASAIVALQERNAVLIQTKIRAAELLTRERGRWAISFLQNFSDTVETVEVAGEQYNFQGIALAGRRFNYVVESGSTVARTNAQIQEQALVLFDKKAIDRRALLEVLNFQNYKEVLERIGESQLDMYLQGLIEAGLEEEQAAILKQYLMQKQTGLPKDESSPVPANRQPQPGKPRAQQG
jgi:hypothetical protein